MPNYSKSKLYFIRSYQTEEVYIGSTTQPLSKRFQYHVADYKNYLLGKQHYISSFEIIKYGDAYIELVRESPCENKEQLHKLEGELIRSMKCVNKLIPCRTQKEWHKEYREKNKEKLKDEKKQYYEKNKEIIKQKRLDYYNNNKEKALETQKKYANSNKEHLKEYNKEYREKNADTIKEHKNQVIICECGIESTNCNLARHKKTEKHASLMALLVLNT